MTPVFTIREIRPSTEDRKLRVTAFLQEKGGNGAVEAQLPAREVAALLPREILIGSNMEPSPQIFDVITELLHKLVLGREVRTWEYKGQVYCSFLKWGSVRFLDEAMELSVESGRTDRPREK